MPLDRRNVTIASRVMLPAYALLNGAFAAAFITDPQSRLTLTPSLDIARAFMPLWAWGLVWFTLASFMVMALVVHHRGVFVGVLSANVAVWAIWGVLVEVAVTTQPNVSYLAGVLPWFVAAASFASMLSLLNRER